MLLKIINKITGFLILLVVLAAGIALIVHARSGVTWTELSVLFGRVRLWGMSAGFALVCLGVIFLLSSFPKKKNQQQYLSFDGEGGTVSISTSSIAEYVARVAGEFPSIVKIKPEVIPARTTIDIHAFIHIKDGPDIHEVCQLLQKRIREVLAGSLGITEVRKVEVSVKEIIAEFNPD